MPNAKELKRLSKKDAMVKFNLETIQAFLDEYMENGAMRRDWRKMKPTDRLMVAERLLNYFEPKRQATTNVVALKDANKTIEETLRELAAENEK